MFDIVSYFNDVINDKDDTMLMRETVFNWIVQIISTITKKEVEK